MKNMITYGQFAWYEPLLTTSVDVEMVVGVVVDK